MARAASPCPPAPASCSSGWKGCDPGRRNPARRCRGRKWRNNRSRQRVNAKAQITLAAGTHGDFRIAIQKRNATLKPMSKLFAHKAKCRGASAMRRVLFIRVATGLLVCCCSHLAEASSSTIGSSWGPVFEVQAPGGQDVTLDSAVELSVAYAGIEYVCGSQRDFECWVGRQDPFSTNLIEITSLGVNSAPQPSSSGPTTYSGWTWLPARAGAYILWATLTEYAVCVDNTTMPPTTNSSYRVQESDRLGFRVHPVNDKFEQATEIPRQTRVTNFPFTLEGATAEAGEPPVFRRYHPQRSLWWTWRPFQAGNVRMVAVQGDYGLPLEVFTGPTLGRLESKANNQGHCFTPGKTPWVRLKVTPNNTYFIRVDGGDQSGNLSPRLTESILSIETISGHVRRIKEP